MGADVVLKIQKSKNSEIEEYDGDFLGRYYGDGYPRGHFPSIFKAILEAVADNYKVWYGSDYMDKPPVVTRDSLHDLLDIYLDEECWHYGKNKKEGIY